MESVVCYRNVEGSAAMYFATRLNRPTFQIIDRITKHFCHLRQSLVQLPKASFIALMKVSVGYFHDEDTREAQLKTIAYSSFLSERAGSPTLLANEPRKRNCTKASGLETSRSLSAKGKQGRNAVFFRVESVLPVVADKRLTRCCYGYSDRRIRVLGTGGRTNIPII
jgi:hypothetical protein